MSNAYKRHGYSYSDIVDYGLATYRNCARRRPIFTHLDMARYYALQTTLPLTGGVCCCELKRWAAQHVGKAREWRLELQG